MIILFLTIILVVLSYQIYLKIFFNSVKFENIRKNIVKHVGNQNDLNHYIQELKCAYVNVKSFDYGSGNLRNGGKYNFNRREWSKELRADQIHNCSSSVCKNASSQPLKYLCKYFNIKTDEDTLSKFESVLNDFISVEEGKSLLLAERESIILSIKNNIPSIILMISKKRLIKSWGLMILI